MRNPCWKPTITRLIQLGIYFFHHSSLRQVIDMGMICQQTGVQPYTKWYLSILAIDHDSGCGGFHTQGTAKKPCEKVSIWDLVGSPIPHISMANSRIGCIKYWHKWNAIFISRVPIHFIFLCILKTARIALSCKCLWLVGKKICEWLMLLVITPRYPYCLTVSIVLPLK